MQLPFHFFRLEPAPAQRDSESIRVVRHKDMQWERPVFRAPTLPTPRQLFSEIPFSANFRAKDFARRQTG
jgi:hypothetical protein